MKNRNAADLEIQVKFSAGRAWRKCVPAVRRGLLPAVCVLYVLFGDFGVSVEFLVK